MWWMMWRAPVHYVVDDVAGILLSLTHANEITALASTLIQTCEGRSIGPHRYTSLRAKGSGGAEYGSPTLTPRGRVEYLTICLQVTHRSLDS
jgi:hypothetical protein